MDAAHLRDHVSYVKELRDVPPTLAEMTDICAGCLTRVGPFTPLEHCRHVRILTKRIYKLFHFCVYCHGLLIKFSQFKDRINENINALVVCMQFNAVLTKKEPSLQNVELGSINIASDTKFNAGQLSSDIDGKCKLQGTFIEPIERTLSNVESYISEDTLSADETKFHKMFSPFVRLEPYEGLKVPCDSNLLNLIEIPKKTEKLNEVQKGNKQLIKTMHSKPTKKKSSRNKNRRKRTSSKKKRITSESVKVIRKAITVPENVFEHKFKEISNKIYSKRKTMEKIQAECFETRSDVFTHTIKVEVMKNGLNDDAKCSNIHVEDCNSESHFGDLSIKTSQNINVRDETLEAQLLYNSDKDEEITLDGIEPEVCISEQEVKIKTEIDPLDPNIEVSDNDLYLNTGVVTVKQEPSESNVFYEEGELNEIQKQDIKKECDYVGMDEMPLLEVSKTQKEEVVVETIAWSETDKELSVKQSMLNKTANEELCLKKTAPEIDGSKISIITLTPKQIEQERSKDRYLPGFVNFPYKCDDCITAFKSKDQFLSHKKHFHEVSGPSVRCSICNIAIHNNQKLIQLHYLTHTRRYECMVCGRRFSSSYVANEHYRVYHEPRRNLKPSRKGAKKHHNHRANSPCNSIECNTKRKKT